MTRFEQTMEQEIARAEADTNADVAYCEGMRSATVCGRPDDTPDAVGQPPQPQPAPLPQKPRRRPRRPGHATGACAICGREAATLVPPEYLFCRFCGYDRPRAGIRRRRAQ